MTRIEEEFCRRTPRSAERARAAEAVMPGGDTRAAAHHTPYPLTLEHGQGPFVWDVDGHRYIDLIGNYTSLVHGHAYPPIVEVLRATSARGTAWAARCDAQIELAALLVERVASVDKIRFTNSGTEAAMLAMHIARVATGRRKILMARYGYHGSQEDTELGLVGQEGPNTYLAEFGNAEAFERALAEHGSEIACVLLEPVMGSAGIVAAPPGFLAAVCAAARREGALFILDEVICFRLAVGGAQERYGVTPDLTLFGKIIGGGLPVGAVGGREDLLAMTDPAKGMMFVSGTFNGNPLTTAAGVVSVRELTAARIAAMEDRATALRVGLEQAAAAVGMPFSVNQAGSLLNLFFTATCPPATIVRTDYERMRRFHLAAMNHGLFFAPRGLIAMSTVMTDAVIDEVLVRAQAAFADVAAEPE
ncbi:MAG: aminotransferase class III-fold pyridoxal phosphate-dependent enzyme [Candidatus Binatia bacterium]|jgi:glutamate-1-semialdehyde 2,1-aminomutase